MACACDSLSPLPVEEKTIMGTWRVLAIPFPPCLSRKRQSWDHGVRLRIPFPPACRGKGSREVPAIRFSPCLSKKRTSRDSAGLRGWGAHGALQGPEGLRGALQGFRRHGITRDRPKWRFSSTGTRNMTFSIRVCALVMAFSFCLSRKRHLPKPRNARHPRACL